jgi:hypothetical protein
MEIADYYVFPGNTVGMSPVFVPRRGGTEDELDGYIVCTVYSDYHPHLPKSGGSEVWIFDAADLKKGPVCKLGHPEIIFGMSLHTAWSEDAMQRPRTDYHVNEEKEFRRRLKLIGNKRMEKLFEKHVYPYYRKEADK